MGGIGIDLYNAMITAQLEVFTRNLEALKTNKNNIEKSRGDMSKDIKELIQSMRVK